MAVSGFGEVKIAARLRDAISSIAAGVVDTMRPDIKIGAVWSVDGQNVFILFAGETVDSLVKVRASASMIPKRAMTDVSTNDAPCDIVRITGKPGQYWIVDYLSGQPQWLGDQGWTDFDFLNGWTTYDSPGSGFRQPGYCKINGVVYFRGLMSSGTIGGATPAFIMPDGFIVTETEIFSVNNQQVLSSAASTGTAHTHNVAFTTARCDLSPDGNFAVVNGSATYVSLSGITYVPDA